MNNCICQIHKQFSSQKKPLKWILKSGFSFNDSYGLIFI